MNFLKPFRTFIIVSLLIVFALFIRQNDSTSARDEVPQLMTMSGNTDTVDPSVAAQDDDQQLRTILMTVSRNMAQFGRSLPDLVCHETLNQEITAKGKVEEKRIIQSILTGRQNKKQTSHGAVYEFEERREIESINGEKPSAGMELPPPHLSGAFSSILLSHFAVSSLPDFEWKLKPEKMKFGNQDCLVLEFSPNENRHKQQYQYGGKTYESRRTGKAFIDPQSLQVLCIEFSEGILPDNLSEWHSIVFYSPVVLDKQIFWLPADAGTELIEKQGGRKLTANHRFDHYKRYTGSIKIDGD